MPVFEIYDEKTPRRVQTTRDHVILGRVGDIVIDDRITSRRHCEVIFNEIGYVLRDLQSRNGVTLNLEPVDRHVSLRDGDEIGIGHATVRFWIDVNKSDAKLPLITLAESNQEKQKTRAGISLAEKPQPPKHKTSRPDRQPSTPPAAKPLKLESVRPVPTRKDKPKKDESRSASRQTDPGKGLELFNSSRLITKSKQAAEPNALGVDQIVLLNHEGKPAQGDAPDGEETSEPMFRLQEMLLKSLQFHATDIHIEPKEDHYQVRYRIDGFLHALGVLETRLVRSLHSIVKLLCNLDINARNVMLDGSFDMQLPDRRVQLRVSIAPSISGDKMVLRVLDTNLAPEGLETLGMDPYVLEQLRAKTVQNSSMIIVCGPTGSGKTTTAYSILREMNAKNRNIVTVEQPVEYKLQNVSQIEISPDSAKGNTITFSGALRSLLRQDPDVILVGEIRDADTARMAVQAAMTGHLMLSTVHARDSISCIFRLLDLGVEPFLLASALTVVLSQRLMRQLCTDCKSICRPAIAELSRVQLDEMAGKDMYTAVGCDNCLGLGYRSRIPIFEILTINDQVRDAIANRPTIQQLRIAAGDWIFQTLREDGVRKLKAGLTTLEEFTRVAYQDS